MNHQGLQSSSVKVRERLRQETDRKNRPGFAELKPEGEGENEASKRASQPYKHPVHGEEAATTAFKLLLMSGSNDNVPKSFGWQKKIMVWRPPQGRNL